MLLKAALNGQRSRREHGVVPETPDHLAAEARGAIDAGAAALHLHPRDADGRESLLASDIAAALHAVRAECPGIPVGVSTGAWIEPDVARRLELIAEWSNPDFASVNFDESGAEAVARVLFKRDIAVEAGLASADAAKRFVAFEHATRCLRVLIEPPDSVSERAEAAAQSIEGILDEAGCTVPRLLHGVDGAAWRMIEIAASRSYDTRIGLEDTLALPDGNGAKTNAELVREALRIIASHRVV